MSYQTMTITPDDGEPFELKVTSRDALIWERTSKTKPASILAYLSYPSMTEAYRLAHIVAKREGRFDGSLSDFEQAHLIKIDTTLEFGPGDGQDPEPDPTQSAASADD